MCPRLRKKVAVSKACRNSPSRKCALCCSGVQIKTRKRNIAVALDPGSFANAVVVCFEDAREEESNDLEKNLQAAVKASLHTAWIYHPRKCPAWLEHCFRKSSACYAASLAGARGCRSWLLEIRWHTLWSALCWRPSGWGRQCRWGGEEVGHQCNSFPLHAAMNVRSFRNRHKYRLWG